MTQGKDIETLLQMTPIILDREVVTGEKLRITVTICNLLPPG